MQDTELQHDTLDAGAKAAGASLPVSNDADTAQPRVHIDPSMHVLGIKIPDIISNDLRRFQHEAQGWRQATIKAAPSAMVNNSSNLVAAMHIVSEGFMVKSNGTELVPKRDAWWRFVTEPPKQIWNSFAGRAKLDFSLRDLTHGSFYKKSLRSMWNIEEATKIASERNGGKLINHWQARATVFGIAAWGINLLSPDVKESTEDTEKMVTLAKQSPIQYGAVRVKQALWYPISTVGGVVQKVVPFGSDDTSHLGENKRIFTGMGVTIAGLCSFLGGFRNVSMDKVTGKQSYMLNPAYCATGLVSLASGLQLMFSVDNDTGYSRFGATHLLRCFFLPNSIGRKLGKNDPNAKYYIAGQAGFQSMNAASFLLAGAEKKNGEIVDHKLIRDEAKEKALLEKMERKISKIKDISPKDFGEPVGPAAKDEGAKTHAMPTAKITQAAHKEMLMGEPEKGMAASVA